MTGKLYVVATPIGNLEDITLRALSVLKQVDLILAEDTRVTKKLLDHYDIQKPLRSYHQHSSQYTKYYILNILAEGKNIALVTDAGTPGISDPGNELIDYLLTSQSQVDSPSRAASRQPVESHADFFEVVPIPGPSALTAALSVSGMNTNRFVFLGFMPKKGRTKLVSWLKEGKVPFAFYESPKRLPKTLKALAELFEYQGSIVVGRELTKKFESIYRGSFQEVMEKLGKDDLKGEAVVIIDPHK